MIANDRKENDRRADCSHKLRSADMSNVLARCARRYVIIFTITDIIRDFDYLVLIS